MTGSPPARAWLGIALLAAACAAGRVPDAVETAAVHRYDSAGIEIIVPPGWRLGNRLDPRIAEWHALHGAVHSGTDVFLLKQEVLRRLGIRYLHDSGAHILITVVPIDYESREQQLQELADGLRDSMPRLSWDGRVGERSIAGRVFETMTLRDLQDAIDAIFFLSPIDGRDLALLAQSLGGRPEVLEEILAGIRLIGEQAP